jgi:cellobiose dehydrogenase (acceptor)
MSTDADKSAVTEFLDSILNAARNSTNLKPSSATTGASLVGSYVSGTRFVRTAMIGTSKESAIVDTNTKVFGTDNVFVVDASMHPDLPTGNTQSIIMVAAEAAAAKIMALQTPSNSTLPSTTPTYSNSTIPATALPQAPAAPTDAAGNLAEVGNADDC